MRVVAAPDKLKGTLRAPQAAAAIARGWRRGDPGAEVVELPVADGGEGTLDVLVATLGGRRRRVRVRGPLGEPVDAQLAFVPAAGGTTAIVEMAAASGLALVDEERRDPLGATTYGTGELILAAARERPARILVTIGGSATTDAGAGMAQAVGVRLLDADGRELPPGGAALARLGRVDASGLARDLRGIEIVVASDVDNPLTGPRGAAAAYGPQKGAGPEDVEVLDRALGHWAGVVRRDLGVEVGHMHGAGAAGGLGAGLVAFLGARIVPGFDVVADALRLADALTDADVAVTAEGRFDEQTGHGKAPAGVLRMAREAGCRRVLICGELADGVQPDADLVYSLSARAGIEEAKRRARELVEDAATDAASAVGTVR